MLRRTCDFRFVPLSDMVKLHEGGYPFYYPEMQHPPPEGHAAARARALPPPVGAAPAVREALAALMDGREGKLEEQVNLETVSSMDYLTQGKKYVEQRLRTFTFSSYSFQHVYLTLSEQQHLFQHQLQERLLALQQQNPGAAITPEQVP